ncbi:MAG TPA: glycosyltransferase, partial [Pseudobdellovibrionaceae bacterium]|nr:glycosyltransferase [Pseudobdellovibrionaceae bacterium]
QYISIADAFIQLSARQASGDSTVFEAMGQRKIIIGSEVSDLVNIITDGEDGYLIRPADTEALAQILISLFLGQLPSELVGQKAHQKIVEMFDTKKMIETLIRSYEKILINSGQYRKNRTQAPIETAH